VAILGRFAFWPVQTEKAPPQRRSNAVSGLHLCPANQRKDHRLVLAHGHILHQAAQERFVEFQNRLRQLFQFRDKPLKFPSADAALADVGRRLFALCLGGLVPADRSVVGGAV